MRFLDFLGASSFIASRRDPSYSDGRKRIMGNSGSSHQNGHLQQRTNSPLNEDRQQWTAARTPYQHKLIVPDRDAHQRLRPTGNGEILHAGGTISGRGGNNVNANCQHQQQPWQDNNIDREPQRQKSRPVYKHNQPRVLTPSHRKDQIKRFGSEPDLRKPSHATQEYPDRYKGRKKYKAPLPPILNTDLSNGEKNGYNNCNIEAGSPIRRARLFKTRAEMKKKISSPVLNNRPSLEKQHKFKSTDALFQAHESKTTQRKLSDCAKVTKPVMQRTKSSPEFQAELMEVTRKLVQSRRLSAVASNENKLKTLDHNINDKEMLKNKLKNIKSKEFIFADEVRRPASGKESSPEQSPPKVKTFYFGMDYREEQREIPNSVSSDLTSESDNEDSGTQNISLQLRPILPKKQLEIPRFSPAAAWKLLSSMDTNMADSTLASEDGSMFNEERIEKLARQPPPNTTPVSQRWVQDKSGDSGISGDETPEAIPVNAKPPGISWTPQQDLGDDSSLEDGSHLEYPNSDKFPTKPHVFSLSLPRENHMAAYPQEKSNLQPYSSLQKLKRSVSGVLGTLTPNKKDDVEQDADENWFLSRSAPNSLNNGFNSLEYRRRRNKPDDLDGPKQTRRIMYLPLSNRELVANSKKHLSKSYENISIVDSIREKPENLQDPPKLDEPAMRWTQKPKKFTFQSTVRQIERKRLADRLSKEAERKEQQRLRELEAMQRVEEEFQKKRAREKATIRQQLRLYSMDDTAWSSLPPNLDITDEVRAEPDGAVSSSASSPTLKKNNSSEKESIAPVTQILSEYKQPYREYKEFRSGPRYSSEQQTTTYPRVTCNMPKATGISYNGNYRKDFAHGIKSGESSFSEESSSIIRTKSPIVSRHRRTLVNDWRD